MLFSNQILIQFLNISEQFSIFSVVQFDNVRCSTGNSETPDGTCFTSTECTDRGGTASGNCANGFGVCCVVSTQTCGSTINQNCSYIQNPGFPATFPAPQATTCAFNIQPVNSGM